MKDVYGNPVLAQWRERAVAGDVSPQWVTDHVVPVLAGMLAMGDAVFEPAAAGPVLRPVEEGRVYYPAPETMPGPEAMFTHFIGSGALDAPWWHVTQWVGVREDGTVDPGWAVHVQLGADDFADGEPGVIAPSNLAQAIVRIASGVTSAAPGTVRQCVLFAAGAVDDVDFDAGAADSVMQVAITGDGIVYG